MIEAALGPAANQKMNIGQKEVDLKHKTAFFMSLFIPAMSNVGYNYGLTI